MTLGGIIELDYPVYGLSPFPWLVQTVACIQAVLEGCGQLKGMVVTVVGLNEWLASESKHVAGINGGFPLTSSFCWPAPACFSTEPP